MEQEIIVLVFCVLPMLVGVAAGAILARWRVTSQWSRALKGGIVVAAAVIVWLLFFFLARSLETPPLRNLRLS